VSYYDLPKGNADVELGREIYMAALSDRRGFRYDQLGIEDEDIWSEIFEQIGQEARAAIIPPAASSCEEQHKNYVGKCPYCGAKLPDIPHSEFIAVTERNIRLEEDLWDAVQMMADNPSYHDLAIMEGALKALLTQALMSDLNASDNQCGLEAILMAKSALTRRRPSAD
jgi:hypothetical protein